MRYRILEMLTLLTAAWFVMTLTHESGHIVCGWLSGGHLKSVDLLPWHLPQSYFEPDPNPLVTLWGGPLLGTLVPWLCAVALKAQRVWFIAYFCLLANGLYLALAWFTADRYLDTARLLAAGAKPMSIAVYCLVTVSIGYHGFRRHCRRLLLLDASNRVTSIKTSK
jgi:hypothetical protein